MNWVGWPFLPMALMKADFMVAVKQFRLLWGWEKQFLNFSFNSDVINSTLIPTASETKAKDKSTQHDKPAATASAPQVHGLKHSHCRELSLAGAW